MLCISVTCEVLKLARFSQRKDEHPQNIRAMLRTEEVSKLRRSRLPSDLQSWNMAYISLTRDVVNDERLKDDKDSHSANR